MENEEKNINPVEENAANKKEEKFIEVSRAQILKAKQEKKKNKWFAFFTNRLTIFGIILLLIVTSLFFLYLSDDYTKFRPEALNNTVFKNVCQVYGLEKFNVSSSSYFILCIFCAVVLILGVIFFLKRPLEEKYEYNYASKKNVDSIPLKALVKFLSIFYSVAAIIGIAGFTVFFVVYPYETLSFSGALDPLANLAKCLGLFFGSLVGMIVALVLVIVLLGLLFKLFKKKPKAPKEVK